LLYKGENLNLANKNTQSRSFLNITTEKQNLNILNYLIPKMGKKTKEKK
jgi:hypothetical protein